jgi:hypothetical protein
MENSEYIMHLFNCSYQNECIVSINDIQILSSLWAGMGSIIKVTGRTKSHKSRVLILKQISLPQGKLSFGDNRKALSYEVECNFYEYFANDLNSYAQYNIVPSHLFVDRTNKDSGKISICMTELQGPAVLLDNRGSIEGAIAAVALFHSMWWGNDLADSVVSRGLQAQGGYWYLDTRPDEFNNIPTRDWHSRLKKAAAAIDARLKADVLLQCIIHGDLKDCNMSYHSSFLSTKENSSKETNAVISFCGFQYCGKSNAMKDIAYLFCVNFPQTDLEQDERSLLLFYYNYLIEMLKNKNSRNNMEDAKDLLCTSNSIILPTFDECYTSLQFAYADLCRWMSGWGYWGCVRFLQKKTKTLLDAIDGGTELPTSQDYIDQVMSRFPVSVTGGS